MARSLRIGGDKSSAFKIANHITSIMPDTNTIEDILFLNHQIGTIIDVLSHYDHDISLNESKTAFLDH